MIMWGPPPPHGRSCVSAFIEWRMMVPRFLPTMTSMIQPRVFEWDYCNTRHGSTRVDGRLRCVGLMWSTFLTGHLYHVFEWCMARLVVKNIHLQDTCYLEQGWTVYRTFNSQCDWEGFCNRFREKWESSLSPLPTFAFELQFQNFMIAFVIRNSMKYVSTRSMVEIVCGVGSRGYIGEKVWVQADPIGGHNYTVYGI